MGEFLEDLRDPDFYARVPESLIYDLEAPHTAIRLYGVLDRHLNRARKVAWPGFRKIQKLTGMGPATIASGLAYLEKANFIRISKNDHKTNHYSLMPVRGASKTEAPASETEAVGASKTEAKGKNTTELWTERKTPAKAVHPDRKQLIDDWFKAYADTHAGNKPRFDGREGKAVDALLAHFGTGQKVMTYILGAWVNPHVKASKYLAGRVMSLAGLLDVVNQVGPLVDVKHDANHEAYAKLSKRMSV